KVFGTHSLRRTKATLIYRRTGNLRAVQLLRGHTKIESTVRYLGSEVDDALAIAEQVDVFRPAVGPLKSPGIVIHAVVRIPERRTGAASPDLASILVTIWCGLRG